MSNRFVITQKNLAEMKIGIMICFSKLYDIPMDEVVDLFRIDWRKGLKAP